MFLSQFQLLSAKQRSVVLASYLGWTLDAFDFFILVFVLKDVAHAFSVANSTVSLGITLTLAARPVGAFVFGRLADRFGRRPILVLDILLFSLLELLSGFAPDITTFIVLRTLFGVAMGGEWGIGSSLTMETIPVACRGLVSGILQAGYPSGYLVASIAFALLGDHIGWRGMFFVGAAPALLVLYIRRNVDESPGWHQAKPSTTSMLRIIRNHAGLFGFMILLMTAFNFFSHGTQDYYPTFLREQHKFDAFATGSIAAIYNVGAILGGLVFGGLSQRFGRKRLIMAGSMLALPAIPLWAFSTDAGLLALGAFLLQFLVQGAWGIVPAHLNELSPPEARGTFPGFTYQLGNFIASSNLILQSMLANAFHQNYAAALSITAAAVAVALTLIVQFSPERREQGLVVARS